MTINEPKQKKTCEWSQDDFEGGTYSTDCGHYFSIIDGTPTENDFGFCCFCGNLLIERMWNEDDQ